MRSWGRGGAGTRGPLTAAALRAQGMKARNLIHARIEENIRAKICELRTTGAGGGCKDALQLLIEHSWERGERLDMQVSGDFRKRCHGIWSPGFPSAATPKRTSRLQSGQTAQTPGMGHPGWDTRDG